VIKLKKEAKVQILDDKLKPSEAPAGSSLAAPGAAGPVR